MRYLIVKRMTPEFLEIFLNEVRTGIGKKSSKFIQENYPDGVPENKIDEVDKRMKMLDEFEEILYKMNIYNMWNTKHKWDQKAIDTCKDWCIWEPQYTEEIFEDKRQGFQSMERIEWNGEIKKVENIDEILSVREANEDEIRAYKEKQLATA